MEYKTKDIFYTLLSGTKTKNIIINVFEDNGVRLVVFKRYSSIKRRWNYFVEPEFAIDILREGV